MLRWDDGIRALVVDLACIEELTIEDVAREIGASVSAVKKFYSSNRDEIAAARKSVQVSDDLLIAVLDMWGSGAGNNEIALATDLSTDVVRRLIIIAEHDEAAADTGADAELAALRAAHPGRLYQDDLRALTEYSVCSPRLLSEPTECPPLGETQARYKALPAPDKRRKITLPGSAVAA